MTRRLSSEPWRGRLDALDPMRRGPAHAVGAGRRHELGATGQPLTSASVWPAWTVTTEHPVVSADTWATGLAPRGAPVGEVGGGALRVVVATLGVVFVFALGGLVAEQVRPAWFAGLRAHIPATPAPVEVPTRAVSSPATTASSAPPPTSALTTAAAGPVIASLEPTSGSPGEQVVVSGSGLTSNRGVVVVLFAGEQALTRCSSVSRCVAVVPPDPGGPGAVVPVRVAAGPAVSGALDFRYR